MIRLFLLDRMLNEVLRPLDSKQKALIFYTNNQVGKIIQRILLRHYLILKICHYRKEVRGSG